MGICTSKQKTITISPSKDIETKREYSPFIIKHTRHIFNDDVNNESEPRILSLTLNKKCYSTTTPTTLLSILQESK